MKVFISWSGQSSRDVAEALYEWLPKVIQGVEPFISAKDIDKGANWTTVLAHELEDADFGIVCLAPDNLLSPWLNYEAGAITKSVNSRVCPVLFGVDKSMVEPPMSQLQVTELLKGDVLLLMTSMNKSAGEPISAHVLSESVDVWWPHLENKIKAIPIPSAPAQSNPAPEPIKPEVDTTEMIEEVLQRVRSLDLRMKRLEPMNRQSSSSRHTELLKQTRENDSVEEMFAIAMTAGLPIDRAMRGSYGIDFQFDRALPKDLPTEIVEAGLKISKSERERVRLIAPNLIFNFDNDGVTQQVQF